MTNFRSKLAIILVDSELNDDNIRNHDFENDDTIRNPDFENDDSDTYLTDCIIVDCMIS
jgi:hypothetical protein